VYDAVFDSADKVETFEDFVEFLLVLEASFKAEGTAWENPTIDRMMESAAAWAIDTAERDPLTKNPTWQNFAQILSAGIIYE